jgi:23S rRNA pseudouridine1911/1915/1917 synthase
MRHEFLVTIEHKGKRVDKYVLENLPELTRSRIKNMTVDGLIFVNDKAVKKAGHTLKFNDKVIVEVKEEVEIKAKPQDIEVDVVYEDEHLAVINKAQGMVVHPAVGNLDGTLVNALLYHFQNLSNMSSDNIRPGIVHRLDKDTSGLLVIAKTDKAHVSLADQIKHKTAIRLYKAVCSGVFKEDEGIIDKNLERSRKDRKKFDVTLEGRGKTAITEYKVIERINNFTFVEFKLQTGRTHQIRVHSRFIGHPVVGDITYGHNYKNIKLKGQLLHAYKLQFTHPATGERMSFEAKLPDYFEAMLKKLSI